MSHLRSLQAKRIALIKPSALGDIVHSLPVLHALRVRFPEARITWVVNKSYSSLLEGHPDLDEVLSFDRSRGWRSCPWLARELWRRKFDLVVDLQGLLRTGLMTAATMAPRRIGLSTAREGARYFYTDVAPVWPTSLHAVERYWLIAEALGVGGLEKQFHVPVPESARTWAIHQLADLPRPWLVVSAGSRWLTKRWPPQHFAELIRRAQEKFGGTAIFVGSVDERKASFELQRQLSYPLPPCGGGLGWGVENQQDSAVFTPTPSLSHPGGGGKSERGIAHGQGHNLTGATTLPQLAAVLSLADVVLANDSGPLHLAAALGMPVVAPYTCTQISRHGPFGQSAHAVETRVWCRGSYLKQCDRLECMHELGPDRLWPVLEEVLFAWASRSRSA